MMFSNTEKGRTVQYSTLFALTLARFCCQPDGAIEFLNHLASAVPENLDFGIGTDYNESFSSGSRTEQVQMGCAAISPDAQMFSRDTQQSVEEAIDANSCADASFSHIGDTMQLARTNDRSRAGVNGER